MNRLNMYISLISITLVQESSEQIHIPAKHGDFEQANRELAIKESGLILLLYVTAIMFSLSATIVA